MRPRYLGDSYDIVKQSFLRWLSGLGTWQAHPMFTERVTPEDENGFSELLGIPLLSADVLLPATNRQAYFAPARACQDHLFLDPDTGLRLRPTTAKGHPSYLFGSEVVALVSERPKTLTLVFDQSLARGRERQQLNQKMAFLEQQGVFSFAYVSHACFILMSASQELMKKAWEAVLGESRLPIARFALIQTTHNQLIGPTPYIRGSS